MFITCGTRELSPGPASEQRDFRRPESCEMSSKLPSWFASNIDPEEHGSKAGLCAIRPPNAAEEFKSAETTGPSSANSQRIVESVPKGRHSRLGVLRWGPQQTLYAMKKQHSAPHPLPSLTMHREQCFVHTLTVRSFPTRLNCPPDISLDPISRPHWSARPLPRHLYPTNAREVPFRVRTQAQDP